MHSLRKIHDVPEIWGCGLKPNKQTEEVKLFLKIELKKIL